MLIEEALKRETRPVDRLYFLFSALFNLDDPDTKLEQYSWQIQEISHFMGIAVPAEYETFSAKITFLRNENIKASRRYGEMMIMNRALPKQEKIEVLKTYIEKEVIKEYRKFAEQAINGIQVSKKS